MYMPISPRTVAQVVGQGGYWTRLDIAEALGREKTTHLINTVEKTARMGLINKLPGYDAQGRETWVYTIEVKQAELGV